MSLNEVMTNLADAVRTHTFNGGLYGNLPSKLSIKKMIARLDSFILATNIPPFTYGNDNKNSVLKDGKQYIKTGFDIEGWYIYPSNYEMDIIHIPNSQTKVVQGLTLETDGQIDFDNTKLDLYLAGNDSNKKITLQNIVKISEGRYRMTTVGYTTAPNKNLEPFNINLSIKGSNYIKLSEPNLNIYEIQKEGHS